MKIAIVGVGYGGIANAVLFVQRHEVCVVDIDNSRIEMVNENPNPPAMLGRIE